jgi:molybdate transport system ATP-binding protein
MNGPIHKRSLIRLEKITVRLYDRLYLRDFSWELSCDENWAILGPNGSGKTTLAKALIGHVPVVRGRMIRHFLSQESYSPPSDSTAIGYVSPELLRDVFEQEDLEDRFRDFSGNTNQKTTVRDLIGRGFGENGTGETTRREKLKAVAGRIGIQHLLGRDIRAVSTGELSKVMIAQALVKEPKLLILDEPFNGLDKASRKVLAEAVGDLMKDRLPLILITHRAEEILPDITHILWMEEGRIRKCGPKAEVLHHFMARVSNKEKDFPSPVDVDGGKSRPDEGERDPAGDGQILIQMNNVDVRYDDTVVLEHFDWQMRRGENWAILGPNGAGKSTVLKLILGENLQAYANEIFLFGKRKGSGESIWEIKRKIGFVSQELQRQYRKKLRGIDVVFSGFYDSIGLYRSCTAKQRTEAWKWVRILGLGDLVEKNFERLSYGQRQLLLIARAMVKSPLLLILDEPCDGLDQDNRKRLLNIVEQIGSRTETDLIYVTHHEAEIMPCITHLMRMKEGRITKSGRVPPRTDRQ